MRIEIKVIPNAKENRIIEDENNFLKIRLTAQAINGKANKALIDILSKKYKVRKNQIKIINGEHSNKKILEINKE